MPTIPDRTGEEPGGTANTNTAAELPETDLQRVSGGTTPWQALSLMDKLNKMISDAVKAATPGSGK
jgi:hypothetical protein